MRNIMAGFAILGILASGTAVSASPRTLSVAPAGPAHEVRQAGWDGDGCGFRCREHRREIREQERRRWAEHQRWQQHHRWEESRYPAPAYGYQHRY